MITIAWRNLWRQRGRTLITLSTISVSLALGIISLSTSSATYEKMIRSALETAGGSVLVHGEGYWDTRGNDKIVTGDRALLPKVKAVPGVVEVIPRIIVQALVSSPRGNQGVQLIGIEPGSQAALKDVSKYLVQGTFLTEPRSLVLGKKLAEDLKLELGDRVVLTATEPNGEITRGLLRLRGILQSGSSAFDRTAAYTDLDTARGVLNMAAAVTQLGVIVRDDERRSDTRAAILAALGDDAAGLEVITWDEAFPELLRLIKLDRNYALLFGIVIFAVVAFGVANTLLMSVLERVRELGLLSALGLTPMRVARLVVTETVLLCAVSSAVGLAMAFPLHSYLANVGIDLAAMGSMEVDMGGVAFDDMRLRSAFVWSEWVGSVIAVFFVVLLSALYPALRASRLEPAQAMRSYE